MAYTPAGGSSSSSSKEKQGMPVAGAAARLYCQGRLALSLFGVLGNGQSDQPVSQQDGH
jgi:hypothetical protein